MCGGDIELAADKTFGTCEFCGSTMTFPKVDDEQRAAAFNRGNHFRRIGEFDKALAVYERIVRENDADAEAHWCCALCRFGIEYVEDPTTYEYIPTCHRASFDSFLEDVDYLAAVEHSEGITKRQYQKDGAKIAEVQRGILATSQNEEPFDVFICYKESDESGNRTKDSLMAQDVYYQLTDLGYRVFFARITLEDMVGKQYEPYIFAALNSAKVMIVIGTNPEYMNAVWVKNEWSRFLAMMKKDRHKLLLPCYRDMDPYDMPEQLSVLQSYDMGKIGFIQDLTRGIKKVLDAEKAPESVKETVVMQQAAGNSNVIALIKRGYMELEDGEWSKAEGFFEDVLNQDAEHSDAYMGLYLAEIRKKNISEAVETLNQKMFEGVQTEYRTVAEQGERIANWEQQMLEKYKAENVITPSDISRVKPKIVSYPSVLAYWESQRDIVAGYVDSHKHLQRAYKFASSDGKSKVEEQLSMWRAAVEEQITLAQQQDAQAEEKILEFDFVKEEQALESMESKKKVEKEAFYVSLCEKQKNAVDIWTLQNLSRSFFSMEHYKDSYERAQQCKDEMKRMEEETKKRQYLTQKWVREGRCPSCGGEYVGLIGKHCIKCGRRK